WRLLKESNDYDFKLVEFQKDLILNHYLNDDIESLKNILKSGGNLIRNFAEISNKSLFRNSMIGTKLLIHDYINLIKRVLVKIYVSNDPHTTSSFLRYYSDEKFEFFSNLKKNFGNTALILQGGTIFGMFHLGVIKSLYYQNLLPLIMLGSGYGSCIASIICATPNTHLNLFFKNLEKDLIKFIDNNYNSYNKYNQFYDNNYDIFDEILLKSIYNNDNLTFLKFTIFRLNNLTFEESFVQSGGRILNIIIYINKTPILLNHITTPNVIISSAIIASIIPTNNNVLLIKDFNDNIINLKEFKFEMSPYQRLTELFNVNNFIISLARPYLSSLISNQIKFIETKNHFKSYFKTYYYFKFKNLIKLQLIHFLENYLIHLNFEINFFRKLTVDEKTPRSLSSSITIVPKESKTNMAKLIIRSGSRINYRNSIATNIRNNLVCSIDNMAYWIQLGEKSVWPMLPILDVRCSIEFLLESI
ncbi:bifunctional triglyceride lipase/lysophosphatidylethanolamine acyltransferase ASCRUDRAFT_24641, partial [Ascoidea rubescens DSM 1968]